MTKIMTKLLKSKKERIDTAKIDEIRSLERVKIELELQEMVNK
jgi:hypothetical protein